MFAAEKCHKGITQLLLDKGSDISVVDKDMWTALHYAARYGHEDVVRFLVERKACTDAQSNKKRTPLMVAKLYNEEKVVKFLQSYSGGNEPKGDEVSHMENKPANQHKTKQLAVRSKELAANKKQNERQDAPWLVHTSLHP